jgi:hypothetical protein
MQRKNRSQLALGIVLILAAAWLIVSRIYPDLAISLSLTWPMWVIFAGVIILFIGMLVGEPGMAVPACIVAGVGGILYIQNAQNTPESYASWSYMWTLIFGFIGVGTLLSGLLGGTLRRDASNGLNMLVTSAVLFAIFGTMFGGWKLFGPYADYAPIALLFLLGIWLIVRGFLRRKPKSDPKPE